MPETRIERCLFVAGLVAIAALGFLVAHLWHHNHGVAAPPRRTTLSGPPPTSIDTTHARATTAASTLAEAETASAAAPISLILKARTDTWLEIRTASSTGALLYSGTLASGVTKHFHARSFWARFGAAGNVLVRLGGRMIRLPSGTYDATFDSRGFRRAGA